LLPLYEADRAVVRDWAEGFQDRDGKFVEEFQTTFNSCFWELYLFAILKRYNLAVDWNLSSPDFVIRTPNANFCIEATTANAAEKKPNEWDRVLTPETVAAMDLDALNHEAIIRLSNALHAKHRAYLSTYSKMPQVQGQPFVTAIAPFEQPFFNMQYDRPIRALLYDYYVDEKTYLANPTMYPQGPPVRRLGHVFKDNGAPIPLGLFNGDAMKEISAVIFSCTATWGKVRALCAAQNAAAIYFDVLRSDGPNGEPIPSRSPKSGYRETLEDGLQVFHNPYAVFSLDPAILRSSGVVQHYADRSDGSWVYEGRCKSLLWRQVWTFTAR